MMTGNQRYMTLGRICADEHEGDSVDDQPDAKRMRRMPSFASVIRGAVATEKIQKICLTLEPFLRNAVHEELERSLSKHGHLLHTAPSQLVSEVDASPSLKLAFTRSLLLPIFTNNKLVDVENKPLEVRLVDTRTNHMASTHLLGSPIKLEVLVLDGDLTDFTCEDRSEAGWTSDEFSGAILREREGRRPLLVGTLNVTMSDQGVAIIDDVSFTDNSSWIRSRRFRIGVRTMPGSYRGPRIREAVSQSFMVKDHRGELHKKHFPPHLTDEIWRLKNIGKEGPIHKRLESEEIKNVQDFLKLHAFNPEKLKRLVGMSDRLWKATVNHAKTCDMGGKSYIFRQEECGVTLTLNPAGEILAARIGDKTFGLEDLHSQQMLQVNQWAAQAYQQWDQLEEVETSRMGTDARNIQVASSYLDQAQRSMPDSSSLLQLSETRDESLISGGPHENTRSYLGTMGGAPVTSNSTAASVAATADAAAAYWNPCMKSDDDLIPCMESDDDLIIWNSMQFSVG